MLRSNFQGRATDWFKSNHYTKWSLDIYLSDSVKKFWYIFVWVTFLDLWRSRGHGVKYSFLGFLNFLPTIWVSNKSSWPAELEKEPLDPISLIFDPIRGQLTSAIGYSCFACGSVQGGIRWDLHVCDLDQNWCIEFPLALISADIFFLTSGQ